MRVNHRIRKFGYTFFVMFAKTQTIEGTTSLLENGLHNPFFDIENCSLEKAEFELGKIQVSYGLPDIHLVSDADRSYRALCFGKVKFTDYLRMQLDLLEAGILDYNFFWHTVRLSKGTLRLSDKANRPKQEVVSVLKSYPVSIPDLGLRERVIYDTGVQKRGLTVFLGEKGKIICGDDNGG